MNFIMDSKHTLNAQIKQYKKNVKSRGKFELSAQLLKKKIKFNKMTLHLVRTNVPDFAATFRLNATFQCQGLLKTDFSIYQT